MLNHRCRKGRSHSFQGRFACSSGNRSSMPGAILQCTSSGRYARSQAEGRADLKEAELCKSSRICFCRSWKLESLPLAHCIKDQDILCILSRFHSVSLRNYGRMATFHRIGQRLPSIAVWSRLPYFGLSHTH